MLGQVGSVRNVIAMSESGAAGVYLNPHGYVHDMITLIRTVNVMPHGLPETANSWYPGYSWTLAYCRSCSLHMVSCFGFDDSCNCVTTMNMVRMYGLKQSAICTCMLSLSIKHGCLSFESSPFCCESCHVVSEPVSSASQGFWCTSHSLCEALDRHAAMTVP